jgi:hypothetical protein
MNRFLHVRLSFVHYGLLALVIAVLGLQSTSMLLASTADNVSETTIIDNGLFYISEAGRFNIMMPMPISLREATLTYSFDLHHYLQLSGPSLDCHQLAAKDYGAVWFVIYCDFPPEALANLTPDEILDNARESTFYTNQPTLIEERATTYDGQFPEREFLYTVDANGINTDADDIYNARAYLINNRLYWIGAMVTAENQDDRLSLIDPFLDSFYVETNQA